MKTSLVKFYLFFIVLSALLFSYENKSVGFDSDLVETKDNGAEQINRRPISPDRKEKEEQQTPKRSPRNFVSSSRALC